MTRTANKRMQSTPNATPRSAAEQPGEEKEGDVTRTMNLEFSDVRLSSQLLDILYISSRPHLLRR